MIVCDKCGETSQVKSYRVGLETEGIVEDLVYWRFDLCPACKLAVKSSLNDIHEKAITLGEPR